MARTVSNSSLNFRWYRIEVREMYITLKFLLENFTVRHFRSGFPPHVNMTQFIRHYLLHILHTYKIGSIAVKNMYSQEH